MMKKSFDKLHCNCQKKLKLIFFCTLGCSSVVMTAIFIAIFPSSFEKSLKKELVLEEGTRSHSEWSGSTLPIYTKMYLFSLANPNQFIDRSSKPILKQLGPYTFSETRSKENVKWHKENNTVSYKIKKNWYFEPEMSEGSLDDLVTSINLPLLAAGKLAEGNYFLNWGLSSMLDPTETRTFVTKTARELLFDGYQDTLLALADWLGPDKSTSDIPMDKFGWFYQRNGTTWADGEHNTFTGSDDLSKMGRIHTWNHKNRTHFRDDCGNIRGSAEGFFPPNDSSRESIVLYSHEVCRSLRFNLKGNETVEGVSGLSYKLDETTFANSSVYPPNYCFENNLPTGVQNLTQCKLNSPTFLSFPHFYLADNFFLDQFQREESDLKPQAKKHESKIVLEPTTGIPMKVQFRLQINVKLDPVEGISQLEKLPKDFYLPVIWFESEAAITPELASSFKIILSLPQIVQWSGLLCILLIVTSMVLFILVKTCRSLGICRVHQREKLKSLSTSRGSASFVGDTNDNVSEISSLGRTEDEAEEVGGEQQETDTMIISTCSDKKNLAERSSIQCASFKTSAKSRSKNTIMTCQQLEREAESLAHLI